MYVFNRWLIKLLAAFFPFALTAIVADIPSAVVVALLTLVAIHLFDCRYDAGLTSRIEEDRPLNWVVMVGKVEVGQLTDAEYAQLQQKVWQDNFIGVAQIVACFSTAIRSVINIAFSSPTVAFWILLLIGIVAPDEVRSLFQRINTAGAEEVSQGLLSFLLIVSLFTYLVALATMAKWAVPPNRFEQDVQHTLRVRFKVLSDSEVSTFVISNPAGLMCDPAGAPHQGTANG